MYATNVISREILRVSELAKQMCSELHCSRQSKLTTVVFGIYVPLRENPGGP